LLEACEGETPSEMITYQRIYSRSWEKMIEINDCSGKEDLYEWRLTKEFSKRYDYCITNENQARKCSDHRAISVISHTEKIFARLLTRLDIYKVKEEDQFRFRKVKSSRDASGLMRIVSERAIDIKEDICAL
jgi:hypothetical protein